VTRAMDPIITGASGGGDRDAGLLESPPAPASHQVGKPRPSRIRGGIDIVSGRKRHDPTAKDRARRYRLRKFWCLKIPKLKPGPKPKARA
jgi:hypothetical protein